MSLEFSFIINLRDWIFVQVNLFLNTLFWITWTKGFLVNEHFLPGFLFPLENVIEVESNQTRNLGICRFLISWSCLCSVFPQIEILGQGLNSHHSSNQSHSNDSVGSFPQHFNLNVGGFILLYLSKDLLLYIDYILFFHICFCLYLYVTRVNEIFLRKFVM